MLDDRLQVISVQQIEDKYIFVKTSIDISITTLETIQK